MRLRAWVCAAAVAIAWGGATAEPRPNIILITVDTFRADHIGYDGYAYDTSPQLDSLSAAGVYFRKAFTTSGWTAPGLVSIQTSLYAPRHGVDIRGRSLDPSVTTLAETLREAGYRAPDIFFLTDIPNFQNLGLEPWAQRNRYVRDGDEILFRWLAEEADASDRPFFLYYHYRDLHQPYNAGPDYDAMFVEAAFGAAWDPLSWVRRFLADEKRTLVQREVMLPRGIIDFAPWDRRWVAACYDAQVRKLDDDLFGRLRRTLRDTGRLQNTIVVVSADHGEELLDHGVIGHVSTFKEGRLSEPIIRIPLIFSAPGLLPPGRVVDDLVQAIDVMPTLLDLAGVPAPAGAQGRSLRPLWEGGGLPPRPVFLETSGGGYTASPAQYARRTRAVRTDRWKLVWQTPGDTLSLYDLEADPGETDDVSAVHPQLADSLWRELRAWVEANPRLGAAAAAALPSADVGGDAQRLRVAFPASGDTLGYVGAGQTIQLEWSGGPGAYTVEYDIGRGAYHLDGVLEVDTNTPSYGPFHADFWNSLVLYNPWRFRVYPQGRPGAASDWVTFRLAPSEGAGVSLTAHAVLAASTARKTATELAGLARGLPLGLLDLGAWLATIPAADVAAWTLLLAIAGALGLPRLRRFGDDRLRAWGLVAAYIGLVYSTVPVFPTVWGRLREHAGPGVAHLGTLVVGSLALWLSIRAVRRARAAGGAAWRLPALLAVLVLYGWLLSEFGRFPAERLHLVEYGCMAFLVRRALRLHLPAASAAAWALVLTAVIGFGDETIQWVLPQRFFELKDVALNVVAGSLGLALTSLASGEGEAA